MNEHELEKALTDRAAVTIAGPRMESGIPTTLGAGHVIAYSVKPMVCIVKADGSKSWHVAELAIRDDIALTLDEVKEVQQLARLGGGAPCGEGVLLALAQRIKSNAIGRTADDIDQWDDAEETP